VVARAARDEVDAPRAAGELGRDADLAREDDPVLDAERPRADAIVTRTPGLVCGALALLYTKTFYRVERLSHRWRTWRPLRPAVAGLATGALGLYVPGVLGTGYGTIQDVLSPQRVLHLSLLVLLAMLGEGATAAGASIYTEPRQILTPVFGAATLTEILAKARADLLDRVRLLLDEELVRFVAVIDAAGPCDDVAAVRLYQAEFSLEAVR